MSAQVPRIALIGVHGYGRAHLDTTLRLQAQARALLVGTADPRPLEVGTVPAGTVHRDNVADLLASVDADVVIVSTPIHTHAEIALVALAAGCDVLLEKPPTATLAEFDAVSSAARGGGRLVQVGFQSLASSAIGVIRDRIAAGAIGEVLRYGASAGWVRDERYWRRSIWAGRRRLDGNVVADGVLTNPLAHATATALAVAGATGLDDVTGVDLDMYRANAIESDDTSVARLTLADGRMLTTAVTLCAASREEPFIEVIGSRGSLRLWYALDVIQHIRVESDAPITTRHERGNLVEGLLESRRTGAPLASPLEQSGGFMRLLDAVMSAPEPRLIPPESICEVRDSSGCHLIVDGVEDALRSALREQLTFRELGVPWAT